MARFDNDLIFEQYFHSLTDVINEARGRKKQFTERVKKIITDPKTGEQRLESYYEMMQRLKRQELMSQADAEYEAEKSPEEVSTKEPAVENEPSTESEPEEDIDLDISASPTEDVGSFNFNATLAPSDLADNGPKDSMSQDIIRYVEDSPATGQEIVDYLVGKGVNEVDAKNKVANLAMLDILKLFFKNGENKIEKPRKIELPESEDDYNDGEDVEDIEGAISSYIGDEPSIEDEFDELPEGERGSEYSEEDIPGEDF